MTSTVTHDRATKLAMERVLMAVVREELLPATRSPEGIRLETAGILIPIARLYSMNRFDLADWPLCGHTGRPLRELAQLLERLHGELERQTYQRLLDELTNSRDNLEDSLEAMERNGLGTPAEGSLADWEGRVWEGHPLHPGNRLRSGVTHQELRRFGPEWQVKFPLRLLELPREDLVVRGPWWEELSRLFPEVQGFDTDSERVAVPVHPWAAERDLPTRLAEPLRCGRFRWLEQEAVWARPCMSFRSVVLHSKTGQVGAHLKLPVAVQTTGATRTVSIASAHNGPLMSGFLQKLWSSGEPRIAEALQGLELMLETASFHLRHNEQDQARFLAGILRQGPGTVGGGWLLPAAALLEPRHNPLFVRAAEHYGLTSLELWQRYCQALLPPQVFLCGRLGIALETHPQNVVVEFIGPPGTAPSIVFHYRDLGGIRMHPQRVSCGLKELGLEGELEVPQFWPGSATSTDSLRDLSSKFVYSLLQNHLGELTRAIVRHTGEEETPYWRTVHSVLSEQAEQFGPDLKERVFNNVWDFKSMWRMRIDRAVTEYTFAPVANPWMAR